jgi:hypothetical protein
LSQLLRTFFGRSFFVGLVLLLVATPFVEAALVVVGEEDFADVFATLEGDFAVALDLLSVFELAETFVVGLLGLAFGIGPPMKN